MFRKSAALLCLAPSMALSEPLFPNSIVSNDLDFILTDDPGACWTASYTSTGQVGMYDRRTDALFVDDAATYTVEFGDHEVLVHLHPDVADQAMRVEQAAASLSRLPDPMRRSLHAVHIHDGDGGAWSEDAGRFITLYEDLMDRRLAEHDLDETVFHETAHVAFDLAIGRDPDWANVQAQDGTFLTEYGAKNPDKEDLAETALFVWTMLYHPGRLPDEIEASVAGMIPARVEYLGNILDGFEPPRCR